MNDSEILIFIYDRLILVHRENENLDFMVRLREIAESIRVKKEVPMTPFEYVASNDSEKEARKRIPIQPVYTDNHQVHRFVRNSLVRYILDNGTIDLNHLACQSFPKEDQQQFAQLIGYSLGGYGELSYVDDETYATAYRMLEEGVTEDQAKIDHYRGLVDRLKEGLKEPISSLFGIHPDDLDRG